MGLKLNVRLTLCVLLVSFSTLCNSQLYEKYTHSRLRSSEKYKLNFLYSKPTLIDLKKRVLTEKTNAIEFLKCNDGYNFDPTFVSGWMNKAPQIKALKLSTIGNQALNIGLEELEFIEEVVVVIEGEIDFELLFMKLNQMRNLKIVTISSRSYAEIKFSNAFDQLVSKLSTLSLNNVAIKSINKNSDNDLKTLVLRYSLEAAQKSSLTNLIEYFKYSENIEDLIIDYNSTINPNDLSSLNTLKSLKRIDFIHAGLMGDKSLFDYLSPKQKIENVYLSAVNEIALKNIHLFKNIMTLEVDKKHLLAISDNIDFTKLKKLKSFIAAIDSLPSEIGNLKNLEFLKLKGLFENIPKSISNLYKLTELDLHASNVTSVPESIIHLERLEKISIYAPKLFKFPTGICQLLNLKYLDVSMISDGMIPEKISNLKQLEYLKIKSKSSLILPNSFGQLTSLKSLILKNNKIKIVPSSFCKLRNLEELNLIGNEISELPNCIGDLQNLKSLLMGYAYIKLKSIPASLKEVDSLRVLRFSNSEIQAHLLDSILYVLSLRPKPLLKLEMQNCQIDKLPNKYWDSIELNDIDFSSNDIQEFPKLLYSAKFERLRLYDNGNLIIGTDEPLMFKINAFLNGDLDVEQFRRVIDLDKVLPVLKIKYGINYANSVREVLVKKGFDVLPLELDELESGNKYFDAGDYEKALTYYIKSEHEILEITSNEYSGILIEEECIRYLVALARTNNNIMLAEKLDFIEQQIYFYLGETEIVSMNKGLKNELCKEFTYLSMFYNYLNNKEKTEVFFRAAKSCLVQNRNLDKLEIMDCLSLLELYLITGQEESFEELYVYCLLHFDGSFQTQSILEYLNISNDISLGNIDRNKIEKITQSLDNYQYTNWISTLVEIWARLFNFEGSEIISILNYKIYPYLVSSIVPDHRFIK